MGIAPAMPYTALHVEPRCESVAAGRRVEIAAKGENVMPVRKASYVDVKVSNRAGQAAKILGALRKAGVNLLAFTGFPDRGGKSQIDLITADLGGVRRVAKKEGWKLSKPKRCFVVQGTDQVGAVHRQITKLARRGINMTAVDAACAGKGRYGMILWVKSKDYARAARALSAR